MTEPSLKFGRLGGMALSLAKNLAGGEDCFAAAEEYIWLEASVVSLESKISGLVAPCSFQVLNKNLKAV